jgi:N-acetylglucosaminyldiphosphoundecaprenol N-acetyl-beta-D-mannosaminyltransferase
LNVFVDEFIAGVRAGVPAPVRFANAYTIALSASDPAYRSLLLGPGVNLPDGVPVGLLVGLKGRHGVRAGQVRGPSFFRRVLDEGRVTGLRHYLLGATPAGLQALSSTIGREFPGAILTGVWAPPFGSMDEALLQDAAGRIAAAAPDVVWVALGTPKQDFFCAELTRRSGVTTVGIGAAFDFVAGTVPEAPVLLRRLGLEWLYRLISEPRRLWRRYLFGNVRFLVEVVRGELSRLRRRSGDG